MTTITKPAYLIALQEEFEKTHTEDVGPVCRWIGIPTPSDCPSPGFARQWGKNEWGEWAKAYGFNFQGEATHGWQWKHSKVTKLTISVAKTPGDLRSPMALATQLRRQVRSVAYAANAIMRQIASATSSERDLWSKSEQFIMDDLINQALSRDAEGMAGEIIYKAMRETVRNNRDGKTVGQLTTLLSRFSEFNKSPRQVMIDIQGEHGEREWAVLKTADPMSMTSTELYDEVKDQLELMKETERAEKEQKRLDREAKEAAAQALQAEKTRPKTPTEIAQTQVDAVHNANLKTLDGIIQAGEIAMRQTGSVLDRARLARQNLAKATITGIEDVAGVKADLAAVRQENDLLRQSQAESLTKVEALTLQIDELQRSATQIDPDAYNRLVGDKTALKAVVSLILDSVVAAQRAGPFEIVNILTALKNEAEEALKNHG